MNLFEIIIEVIPGQNVIFEYGPAEMPKYFSVLELLSNYIHVAHFCLLDLIKVQVFNLGHPVVKNLLIPRHF